MLVMFVFLLVFYANSFNSRNPEAPQPFNEPDNRFDFGIEDLLGDVLMPLDAA